MLNFAGGVGLGLALLLPVERLPGRAGAIAVPVLAFTGAAMAATSIAFLLISQQTPLFGFLETSTTSAITVAFVTESIATAALGARRPSRHRGRRRRAAFARRTRPGTNRPAGHTPGRHSRCC